MSTTQEVLDHHLQCFSSGDLEGIMADYAEDAVIETNDTTVSGAGGIRALFSGLFAEFAKGSPSFEMLRTSVNGDHAYIIWKAQTEDRDIHLGTDTFVLRDGKIVYQTFSAHTTPRG